MFRFDWKNTCNFHKLGGFYILKDIRGERYARKTKRCQMSQVFVMNGKGVIVHGFSTRKQNFGDGQKSNFRAGSSVHLCLVISVKHISQAGYSAYTLLISGVKIIDFTSGL